MGGGEAVSILDQIAFDQIADERDKANQENKQLKERIKRLEEALDCLTLVVGLTPIAGNKDALQEAVDLARAALRAKEAKP
jgi:cell division septum initiation protein DivIVA